MVFASRESCREPYVVCKRYTEFQQMTLYRMDGERRVGMKAQLMFSVTVLAED
jgi:hypothetical protein